MVRIIKTTSFRPYNFTHNRAHRISLIKYQFGNITKSVFGRQIPPIAPGSIGSNLQGISTFPLRYPIDSNRIAEVRPIGSLNFSSYNPSSHSISIVRRRIFPVEFQLLPIQRIPFQNNYLPVRIQ